MILRVSHVSARDRSQRLCTPSLEAFARRLAEFRVRDDVTRQIDRDRELVRSGRASGWLREQVEARGVEAVLEAIPRWAKRSLSAWSPATFPAGAPRAAANVEAVSCLVLDVDDGTPLDRVWALWPDRPRMLHTSWSHSLAKPKCRLVVPLAEPVPGPMWDRVWLWMSIYARRRGVVLDRQCSNPDRLYFAPAVPSADAPREARTHLEGDFLRVDWHSIPDPVEARRAVQRARAPLILREGQRVPDSVRYADPAVREQVAHAVGARLLGAGMNRRADRVTCPACGRPSVFFYIAPERMQSARCDHRRSCGWFGSLRDLELGRRLEPV